MCEDIPRLGFDGNLDRPELSSHLCRPPFVVPLSCLVTVEEEVVLVTDNSVSVVRGVLVVDGVFITYY